MANLNLAEKRVPQDGRIRITLAGRPVDLRVSTLPTPFGESVVLRILDKSIVSLDLDLSFGLNPDNGGAEIVHFDTPSGGEVFSVGSITWPACILVDEAVSQITANVLRRFLQG